MQLFTIVTLVTMLLSAAVPLVHADGTWTNQTPGDGPSARGDAAMVSPGGDQVLLFGGDTASGKNGETWVYDLGDNAWTNQAPSGDSPSARSAHAMAWVDGDQVLLFGGREASYNVSDETWVYDLSANTWTNQAPAAGPSARISHAMAWVGGDRVLLFGGHDGSYIPNGETWVYDLSDNTWTNLAPAVGPSARHGHAMTYLGGDQVLLLGGMDPTLDGDTWVYDLSENTWTNQAPAASPSARYGHAMTYLGGDQVLLFGGYDDGGNNGETWVYDLSANTWTNQAPAVGPSARQHPAMVSLGQDRVLLFGGWDGNYSDETWLATGFCSCHRTYLPVVVRNQ